MNEIIENFTQELINPRIGVIVHGWDKYSVYPTSSSKNYIGLTTDPNRRFKSHMNVAKHKWRTLTKCGRAVKRYGPDTFHMAIIHKCSCPKEAQRLEKAFIKKRGIKKLWNSNKGGRYVCVPKKKTLKTNLLKNAQSLESELKSSNLLESEEDQIELCLSKED